jgi:hypothetical protein
LRINLNESDTNFRTTIPITLQLPPVPLYMYNGTIKNYYSIDPDVLGDKKKKKYSRNVMNVDWGLVVKLALPAKVTRRANKVIGIYDRSH